MDEYAGFGAIIRDHRGLVLVTACNRTQDSLADAIIAEAWAGMAAATLCKDIGIFYVRTIEIPSK
jgi:hypothetical protein